MTARHVAIIGGGPAGLMAAERLAGRCAVTVFDAMPTLARKFLMAGKSGLNLTHSEEHSLLKQRFGAVPAQLTAALDAFDARCVQSWAEGLGVEVFTGSSGRVFPKVMKASPLLRAWLTRLTEAGVALRPRHRWLGFDGTGSRFATEDGEIRFEADATLLALGGASWPRLGSDAAWVPLLAERGIQIAPFRPANCGFDIAWSDFLKGQWAGAPVKGVTARSDAGQSSGEFVVTASGIEGGLVYSHASALRDALEQKGHAAFTVDLCPGRSRERLAADLARQPAGASFSTRLRKGAGLSGVKSALLREVMPPALRADPGALADHIKALALPLLRPRPIAEAISSAGGIAWDEIDPHFMLRRQPGIFTAGEMIDWDAPTGGYLLTACFATGRAAGDGIAAWLDLP